MNFPRALVNKYVQQSIILHFCFVAAVLVLLLTRKAPVRQAIIEIIEYPTVQSSPSVQPQKIIPKVKPPEKRAVFGVNRDALTAEPADLVQVKSGNTVAKQPDDSNLNPQDESRIPIPTDDYLVTKMPRLKTEVRIPYPETAKNKGAEGAVVMDLLIDQDGNVRQVELVKGVESDLDQAALSALRRFEFEPALVGENRVAVKIRYTYRFVLESR